MKPISDFYDEHFEGRWRIVSTELWDQAALDLVVPANICFGSDRLGGMQFIAVDVTIDYRTGCWGGCPFVEFTFAGRDDGKPTNGRGWARLVRGELQGKLFIHQGDESWFAAELAG